MANDQMGVKSTAQESSGLLGLTPQEELIAPIADALAEAMEAEAKERQGAKEPQGTPVFGLLGRTLSHSWSPKIHGHLGSAPYVLFEKEPNEVESFLREGSWQGLNVTIPYKKRAFELADEVSELCQELGATNTLVKRKDGTIFATNTDVAGFRWLLERFCSRAFGATPQEVLAQKEALVLGSGGASTAVSAALKELPMNVSVISRQGSDTYATLLERHRRAALVVNTTPVGMFPACPQSPLSPTQLAGLVELQGVIDIIYNPLKTGLLLEAERRGIPCEGGLAMLVGQAFASSEAFQQTTLPSELLERTLGAIKKDVQNIFFIGMPGCGKTGAARRLAHSVSRPFVDLDDAFLVEVGSAPGDYILAHGESAFRNQETALLANYAKRSGIIFACGGGVVERPENLDLLRQNGLIVFLDRPLEELSLIGRPISLAQGVEAIAKRRMSRYHGWADFELSCTGTAEGDALAVREWLDL